VIEHILGGVTLAAAFFTVSWLSQHPMSPVSVDSTHLTVIPTSLTTGRRTCVPFARADRRGLDRRHSPRRPGRPMAHFLAAARRVGGPRLVARARHRGDRADQARPWRLACERRARRPGSVRRRLVWRPTTSAGTTGTRARRAALSSSSGRSWRRCSRSIRSPPRRPTTRRSG
jgi:hypothetical protein